MLWVKELIKEARAATQPWTTCSRNSRDKFAYEPRLILLELIYQILYTKSRASPGRN